ncbi:MAG: hypothetical protein AMS27_08730 [Bacteroides sp. SM23_62_1]|nr:MAG: hypothetical protein AMS27_08730 [Bacteroides sp. SM23_62_1]
MYFPRKLKQDFRITGFIPAISCLLAGALFWIFIGKKEAFLAVSVFFILYAGFSFSIYIRTRNQSYLAACLWQLLFGMYLLTRFGQPLIPVLDSKVPELIFVLFLASTVWLLYLFFTKRAKWKGREVFELASMTIEPVPDGFTDRPRPAGKAEYTRDELIGFAGFLRKHLIAMPCFEENQVVFVPVKMGDEFRYLFNREKFRRDRSWIAFDYRGNVSVVISRIDYIDYKEELSFDQLCENLGKLFIGFMGYYRKGEADRIVYKLNELGLGKTS